MPDDSLLTRLDALDQYVRELRESQPPNFHAYESDKMLRRYTERMLQMVAETCIHIGIGVLAQEGLRSPENYHDIFIALGERGILPHELVDTMTVLVELRNLLVYEHASVDDLTVYAFTKKHLGEIAAFANTVREYRGRQDAQPST